MTPVFGFVGRSGTGKTTLMEAVIRHLAAKGLRVAAIKHGHHAADPDKPGKDSHRFRQAGAETVLFTGPGLWFMVSTPREEPSLEEQIVRLAGHDLILVEGCTNHPHPKIVVRRADAPEDFAPSPGNVAAVASDLPPRAGERTLPLDDPAAAADFILEFLGIKP